MGSKLLYEVFRDHPKSLATLWRDPNDSALNLTSSEMFALTHVLTVMQDPPGADSCIYFESREQLQERMFSHLTYRRVVNLACSLFSKLAARGLVTEVARGRKGQTQTYRWERARWLRLAEAMESLPDHSESKRNVRPKPAPKPKRTPDYPTFAPLKPQVHGNRVATKRHRYTETV